MQDYTVGMRGARRTGAIAVVLAATLVALAAVIMLAKPSGALVLDPVTLTVEETEIGFGALQVDGSVATRTITVTNTGSTPIVIDGVTLRTATGELLLDSDFTADLGPDGTLTVGNNGGTGTFTVSFDPSTAGVQEALLSLEGLVDGTIVDTIRLVDEAGNTATAIDLSGTGSQTNPFLQPGAQGCDIVGTSNGEVLTGTGARDVICALGGPDRVSPRGGNDVVRGGKGNDIIRSSNGRDSLNGGAGGDRITDKAGRRGDRLSGKGGEDTLIAKDGRSGDLLVGGAGQDRAFKDKGDTVRSI